MLFRSYLRLNDFRVKRILAARSELNGKKLLGRGMFSLVFEGSSKNTVYKLTADPSAYGLLTDGYCGVTHRHFPKVIKEHGEVGEVMALNDGKGTRELIPVFLVELERLYPLTTGNAVVAHEKLTTARKTTKQLSEIRNYGFGGRISAKHFSDSLVLPRSLRNAFKQIQYFAEMMAGSFELSDLVMDLHKGNIMLRKNGELVLADPVASRRLFRKMIPCD